MLTLCLSLHFHPPLGQIPDISVSKTTDKCNVDCSRASLALGCYFASSPLAIGEL